MSWLKKKKPRKRPNNRQGRALRVQQLKKRELMAAGDSILSPSLARNDEHCPSRKRYESD